MEKTDLQLNSASNAEWRGFKVLDWICAVLLALLPILQHYRGLIWFVANAFFDELVPAVLLRLATKDTMTISLMLLMAPYLLVRLVRQIRNANWKKALIVAPLFAFYAYKLFNHGTSISELIQVGLSVFYLLVVALGCVDLKKFLKAATIVGCIAGVAMILQYICYYLFGFHLQMVAAKLLLPSAEKWVAGIRTGRVSVLGTQSAFYRPAAIFLEPSHLFIYCFPLLFINLYKNGKKVFNWVASGLLSVAIVLSTSGMGVMTIFGAWVLFATLWDDKTDSVTLKSLKKGRQWLRGVCTAVVLILLFLNVPSINSSMARVIGKPRISLSMLFSDSDEVPDGTIGQEDMTLPGETLPTPEAPDRNAVSGRIKGAMLALKEMSLTQWIFGCSDTITDANVHMSGFASTAYRYGIIGLLLSYCFFAFGLFKLDAEYFWFTVIWFAVSFFSAHTHGMSYLLYYVMFLYGGHMEATGKWPSEIKAFFSRLFRLPAVKRDNP